MLSLAGLNASGYRLPPLIRRIPACLRALKTDCLESALSMVQYDSKQLETAINALLIGTTSFFRDASVFASLDRFQIPGIIQRSPNPRVLSVASSGGEELYSIAMLFARHGALSRSRFVGRDCRPSAIATASRGCYSAHAGDIIPADLAAEHVSSVGGNLRIRPHLASKIEWECRDSLDKPAPSEKWDLILCRNLAIYLEAEVTRELWANLTDALAPGGFLVVGRAEKPRTSDLNCIAPCIYQKSNF
ncbi:MAG: CheR family methyltransferase [Akkermansiaceae bacterium]